MQPPEIILIAIFVADQPVYQGCIIETRKFSITKNLVRILSTVPCLLIFEIIRKREKKYHLVQPSYKLSKITLS